MAYKGKNLMQEVRERKERNRKWRKAKRQNIIQGRKRNIKRQKGERIEWIGGY